MYPVRMSKTFRQALLDALESTGKTLAEVAEASGVSYEQLKKVRARDTASTNVDDAMRVARVFGLTINEFMDDDLAADRAHVAKIYSQLSPAERRLIAAAAKGMQDDPPA